MALVQVQQSDLPSEAVRGREAITPLMSRNALVDALRGACFVFMTVDHLPDNPFGRVSNAFYGPFGFFTAALGFVFLSGLVAGLVYDKHRVNHGARSMTGRVLRRIRALYVTQMILLLTLAAALALHLHGVGRWDLATLSDAPWKGLGLGAVLLYEPGYLGILPMYCFFLALTPIILWQFQRGNFRYVLGTSVLLWIISGLMIQFPDNPEGVTFGSFNPLSYQIVFVVGLAFGTGHLSIERLTPGTRRWLIASSATVAVLFLLLRQQYAVHGPLNPLLDRVAGWFSLNQLGPLRLLSFAAFAFVLYSISRKIELVKVHPTGFRWLAFVGRHSLPVFAWSILATYAALVLFPSYPNHAVAVLGVVLAVASLTVPAQLHAVGRRRLHSRPAFRTRLVGPLKREFATRISA